MKDVPHQIDSPWPHRWAVALVCATFPMIWIGGLVTTYGAGMAVPDWPNTYGYNLFLYPWQTWVFGPWKLFIEHGHRLLGTLVGMISDRLPGFRLVVPAPPVGALAGRGGAWRVLSCQGMLGGMRVVLDEVQLAQIHGCVGPAFFAFTVALAVVTSRRWQQADSSAAAPAVAKIERLALIITFLALLQLVLGSQLRHLPAGAGPATFAWRWCSIWSWPRPCWCTSVLLAVRAWRTTPRDRWLVRPALGLLCWSLVQIALGTGPGSRNMAARTGCRASASPPATSPPPTGRPRPGSPRPTWPPAR